MRTVCLYALIAGVLLSMGTTTAQDAKEAPSKPPTLAELQAAALKNNGDIKVAEAKVRLAEAELDRVRAHVQAKVAVAFAEFEATRLAMAEGTERYQRVSELYNRRPPAISKEEFSAAKLTAERLRAEFQLREAELRVIVGVNTPKATQKARDKQ